MTVFLVLIGAVGLLGIVASFVVVSRDGYRRQPTLPLATTYRHSPEAAGIPSHADVRPSDLIASQWLHDAARTADAPRQMRHAAGGMVLRPW